MQDLKNSKQIDDPKKKEYLPFVILSWTWLSIVLMASLVPKPKSIAKQIINYFLHLTSKSEIDKNVHFMFYFLLVFLFCLAYTNQKKRVILFLVILLFSGAIELLQPVVTHSLRKCDKHDFVYNVYGSTLGLIIALSLEYFLGIFRKLSLTNFNKTTINNPN